MKNTWHEFLNSLKMEFPEAKTNKPINILNVIGKYILYTWRRNRISRVSDAIDLLEVLLEDEQQEAPLAGLHGLQQRSHVHGAPRQQTAAVIVSIVIQVLRLARLWVVLHINVRRGQQCLMRRQLNKLNHMRTLWFKLLRVLTRVLNFLPYITLLKATRMVFRKNLICLLFIKN